MVDFTKLPFHMPGHKRNTKMLGDDLPYGIDITEITGADDLHNMQGALKTLAERAAALYGAERAFPMVNGSTGGILAAVRTVAKLRPNCRSLVMTREAHKSIYNAAELCRLKPVHLESTVVQEVTAALAATDDACAVLITSPTYLGDVADIELIAGLCRAARVPLIVDAAHGAHFGFSQGFPQNATRLGADIEILSLHKTLPALTQSSLILATQEFAGELERQLRVFETSSPSYVLLESIKLCVDLLNNCGATLFAEYEERLRLFYERTGLAARDDIGKIVLPCENGPELMSRLREEFDIELEMCGADYALAMTSIADEVVALQRLADAVTAIGIVNQPIKSVRYHIPKSVCAPFEAADGEEFCDYRRALGSTAREYVWAYPPGVPLLVPGEIVDADVIAAIEALYASEIEPRSDFSMLPEIAIF